MKHCLLVVLAFLSVMGICQQRNFELGFQLFPNFSTGIPDKNHQDATYYQGKETFIFSYSGGVQLDWNITEKWTLSSGILYKRTGEKSKIIPADLNRGFLYPHQYGFRFHYVEIPLNLNRNLGKNWLIEFGVSPMVRLVGKFEFLPAEELFYTTKFNKSYLNVFGLNTNLGIGFRKSFDQSTLKIIPYAQFNVINSINEIEFIFPDMKNFSGGLKLAWMFGLRSTK